MASPDRKQFGRRDFTRIALLGTTGFLTACAPERKIRRVPMTEVKDTTLPVGLSDLIKDPGKYLNKDIVTTGFVLYVGQGENVYEQQYNKVIGYKLFPKPFDIGKLKEMSDEDRTKLGPYMELDETILYDRNYPAYDMSKNPPQEYMHQGEIVTVRGKIQVRGPLIVREVKKEMVNGQTIISYQSDKNPNPVQPYEGCTYYLEAQSVTTVTKQPIVNSNA